MLSPFWSVGTIPPSPSLNNTLWALVPAVSNFSSSPLPNRALARQQNLHEDHETDVMKSQRAITLTQGFVDTMNKDTTTSIHQEVACKSVCKNLFYGRKQSCNRFIRYKFSSAGLGHQFGEFLFAAEFARTRNFSLHIARFVGNKGHGAGTSSYSGIMTLLGYHELSKEFDMSMNVSEPVTQELLDLDPTRYKNRCAISVTLTGYKYCKGTRNSNCFRDAKHAYAFQIYQPCLRCVHQKYGNVSKTFYFGRKQEDRIDIVWHCRMGDITLHDPRSTFYNKLLQFLSKMLEGLQYRVNIYIVGGGGRSTKSDLVPYLSRLRTLVREYNFTSQNHLHIGPQDVTDAFVSMLDADILIGTGSSFVTVAALYFRGGVYFNHESKVGFNNGLEMFSDGIDVDANGNVLDSLRRVRAKFRTYLLDRNRHLAGDLEERQFFHDVRGEKRETKKSRNSGKDGKTGNKTKKG
jgi:hypothetical protein